MRLQEDVVRQHHSIPTERDLKGRGLKAGKRRKAIRHAVIHYGRIRSVRDNRSLASRKEEFARAFDQIAESPRGQPHNKEPVDRVALVAEQVRHQ